MNTRNKNHVSMEELHKEIDLIQSCISRMSQNSFSCKEWNLTLVAGVFALVHENINKWHICVVLLCIDLCFWWLDAFFVLEEKKYREKYEWVIHRKREGNVDYLYDLNPDNKSMKCNLDKTEKQWQIALSKTLLPMYGGIAVLLVLFVIVRLIERI